MGFCLVIGSLSWFLLHVLHDKRLSVGFLKPCRLPAKRALTSVTIACLRDLGQQVASRFVEEALPKKSVWENER